MASLRLKSVRAFTLMEVLLVVSLISLIGGAIYNAFSGSIRVWKSVQGFEQDQEVAIFLDRFEQELRNAMVFESIPFEGRQSVLSFPTVIKTRADEHVHFGRVVYVNQVGRVRYAFDPEEGIIYREEANYSQALRNRYSRPRPVLASVVDITFNYFKIGDNDLIVTDITDELPSGIELKLEYLDRAGRKQQFSRIVNLPRGVKL